MSTSKHIDKLCLAAALAALVLTVLFCNAERLGVQNTSRTMGYEDSLFDSSMVHTVDIVMDNWDGFLETCENEEYAVCTAVIDGERVPNVGIRAKGNTSLRNVSQMGSDRYSFKLEFDQYDNGITYHGLDKLCLNNLIQDNTMMKDYLVYQMMDDFGVDAPLCSYAYLTVNGEDWGLYLAVEAVEDSFLQRNYGADTGELYKPDSMQMGGGPGNGREFSMGGFDFEGMEPPASDGEGGEAPQSPETTETQTTASSQPPQMPTDVERPQMPEGAEVSQPPESGIDEETADTEKPADSENAAPGVMMVGPGMGSADVKLQYIDDDPENYSNIFDSAKTDVTDADKTRLINALKNLSEYTDLESTIAMEEVLSYFAVHNFVCNGDSYTGAMVHNYYLREQDGRLSMIPWDYNLAFGTFQGGSAESAESAVNAGIDEPSSGVENDDRPMMGWIFSDEAYTGRYHDLYAQFLDRWFTDGELSRMITDTAELIRPYVERDPTKFCTTEEFDAGVQALSQFVTLRAESVSNQLAGDDTPVDTGTLNLSDMGTMGDAMGGFPGRDREQAGGSEDTLSAKASDGNRPAPPAREGDVSGKEPSPVSSPQSMPPEGDVQKPDSGESRTPLLLTGISLLVLLSGLLIAGKFKP